MVRELLHRQEELRSRLGESRRPLPYFAHKAGPSRPAVDWDYTELQCLRENIQKLSAFVTTNRAPYPVRIAVEAQFVRIKVMEEVKSGQFNLDAEIAQVQLLI